MPSWSSLLLLVAACTSCVLSVPIDSTNPRSSSSQEVRPWMNVRDTPQQRAAKLLAEMTVEEKVGMLYGVPGDYVGNVAAIDRLGVPAINMNDGPQGFRANHGGTSTAFPSGLSIAASFNPDMAYLWGKTMGEEFWNKGSNVQLGPGMCVARVPNNGRNFEYLSGEDPMLGYYLVKPAIDGIQSQNVIANAKHWVLNNQETNRTGVSSEIDERTFFEIYSVPFQGAVEAGVGSFMCSYNKINGFWSCENKDTLKVNLKERLGFEGWVMSDWGATHSTSIEQGLDQEMPGGDFMGVPLLDLVNNGTVSSDTLDDSVTRILVPMFQFNLFDIPNNNSAESNVTSEEHVKVAREIASDSIVLLKNDKDILPLTDKVKNIVVVGGPAVGPIVGGGGSGAVDAAFVATPLAALHNYYGIKTQSNCSDNGFEKGVDFFQSKQDFPPIATTSVDQCCEACAITEGCKFFSWAYGTCYLKKTDAGRTNNDVVTSGQCTASGDSCNDGVCVNYAPSQATGAAMAAKADLAIVFVETTSSEGSDRESLSLGNGQDELIADIVAAQPNTVVVAVTPGALLTPWAKDVAGLIVAFMPGQEYGNALLDILVGEVNPSGRLPLTMPNIENEVQFTTAQYPGSDDSTYAHYSEKLQVGYRWYLANDVKPAFPFSFGLSYTTFEYGDLSVTQGSTKESFVVINVNVTNTGSVAGKDVIPLFMRLPSASGEPFLQLKNFHKTDVMQPHETTQVTITLPFQALCVWNEAMHGWTVVPGKFHTQVGMDEEAGVSATWHVGEDGELLL